MRCRMLQSACNESVMWAIGLSCRHAIYRGRRVVAERPAMVQQYSPKLAFWAVAIVLQLTESVLLQAQTHTHTHAHMHTRARAADTHTPTLAFTHALTHTSTHTRAHTHARVHTHTPTDVRKHTRTRAPSDALRVAHCRLHIAHFLLHVARCMSHVARCMSHVACRMLHVARRPGLFRSSLCGRRHWCSTRSSSART